MSTPGDVARPLVFFGGKGGVGKTTLATAAALHLAGEGLSTLLVSTDPAHSTGDLLEVRLADEPARVGGNLWAVEIDAEAAAADHVARIKQAAAESVDRELLPTVERHLDLARSSPGTVESALFDRLADLLETAPGSHDRLVVDTAPTGHTLRLLALPALLSAWVEGLVRQREKAAGLERMLENMAGEEADPDADPVLARLRDRRSRMQRAAQRLRDDAVFWLVLIPERLPVEETARAAETLAAHELSVGGLVVNRLLPADRGDEFLATRRREQDVYLDEIGRRFAAHRRVLVPQLARDVGSRAQLDELAGYLPSDW